MNELPFRPISSNSPNHQHQERQEQPIIVNELHSIPPISAQSIAYNPAAAQRLIQESKMDNRIFHPPKKLADQQEEWADQLKALYKNTDIWGIDFSSNHPRPAEDAESLAATSMVENEEDAAQKGRTLTSKYDFQHTISYFIRLYDDSPEQYPDLLATDSFYHPAFPLSTVRILRHVKQLCFEESPNPVIDENWASGGPKLKCHLLAVLSSLMQFTFPEDSIAVPLTIYGEELPCNREMLAYFISYRFRHILELMRALNATRDGWVRFFASLRHYIPSFSSFHNGLPSQVEVCKILAYQIAFATHQFARADEAMDERRQLIDHLNPLCIGVRIARCLHFMPLNRSLASRVPQYFVLTDAMETHLAAYCSPWLPIVAGQVMITGSTMMNVLLAGMDLQSTIQGPDFDLQQYMMEKFAKQDLNVVPRPHLRTKSISATGISLYETEEIKKECHRNYPGPMYRLLIEEGAGGTALSFQLYDVQNRRFSRKLTLANHFGDGGGEQFVASKSIFAEAVIFPLLGGGEHNKDKNDEEEDASLIPSANAKNAKKKDNANLSDASERNLLMMLAKQELNSNLEPLLQQRHEEATQNDQIVHQLQSMSNKNVQDQELIAQMYLNAKQQSEKKKDRKIKAEASFQRAKDSQEKSRQQLKFTCIASAQFLHNYTHIDEPIDVSGMDPAILERLPPIYHEYLTLVGTEQVCKTAPMRRRMIPVDDTTHFRVFTNKRRKEEEDGLRKKAGRYAPQNLMEIAWLGLTQDDDRA